MEAAAWGPLYFILFLWIIVDDDAADVPQWLPAAKCCLNSFTPTQRGADGSDEGGDGCNAVMTVVLMVEVMLMMEMVMIMAIMMAGVME